MRGWNNASTAIGCINRCLFTRFTLRPGDTDPTVASKIIGNSQKNSSPIFCRSDLHISNCCPLPNTLMTHHGATKHSAILHRPAAMERRMTFDISSTIVIATALGFSSTGYLLISRPMRTDSHGSTAPHCMSTKTHASANIATGALMYLITGAMKSVISCWPAPCTGSPGPFLRLPRPRPT